MLGSWKGGYQCDCSMKLDPPLCTNEQTEVVVMVAGFGVWGQTKLHQEPPGLQLTPLSPSPSHLQAVGAARSEG